MVPKNWRSRIFEKKIFLAKNGEKGVKNMHFWAFLGNHAIDFSDFWYVASLIYYFNPIPHGMFWDAQLTGWGQKWPPRLNSTKIFQMAQNLVHMLKNIRRANKMKI